MLWVRLCVWALALLASAGSAWAQEPERAILSAQYDEPTTRYAHGVLGDAIEWGALRLRIDTCPNCAVLRSQEVVIRLPQTRVFEDLEPRLADVDLDGAPEVITVESDQTQGARLAIYDADGLVAATPFIGRANRWLAPLGAADLDGDGFVEIAYVDRPHLARTLRIWRFKDGVLTEVAQQAGVSNHRIGWDYIVGGIRHCQGTPDMILADGRWQDLLALRLQEGKITARRLAPWSEKAALAALTCS